MVLTKRLSMCAELVSGKGIACDVGTDHAYLATHLLRSGKCEKIIASDVAEGPLSAAEKTLMQAGLIDRAELILSDGLLNIPKEGVTDVVIAGMGGETIVHILEKCSWIKSNVDLILQPMTKSAILRTWLCQNGFNIVCEKIVCEGRFFYTVIKARYDGIKRSLSKFELELGILDWNNDIVKEYALFRNSKFIKLANQLKEVCPDMAKEYEKLSKEITDRCEVK